jgi:CDP-diacylglycerol--serine O-phosphatidyltransferase
MDTGRHFSMIRGFHVADWLTLANAVCGAGGVLASLDFVQSRDVSRLLVACALVALALVFDVLDVRVARWRRESSMMGRELDSLADVISFGVAPAAIAYAAGMQGFWDAIILMYFVACGVSRLARYNVTAEQLAGDESGKVKYFEGTPIPTSVVLTGVLAWAGWQGDIGARLWGGVVELGPWDLHPLVLLFVLSGTLMISKTLRIPKL